MTKTFVLVIDTNEDADDLKKFLRMPVDMTGPAYDVISCVEEQDIDVYNDLPAPFNQQYANLHDKMENFIVDAIEGGVNEEDLRAMMLSDVDQLIANHGVTLDQKRDQFNRRWFPEVATVPAIGTQRVCDDCGKTVVWVLDQRGEPGWSSELSLTARQFTPDFLCGDWVHDVCKLHTA